VNEYINSVIEAVKFSTMVETFGADRPDMVLWLAIIAAVGVVVAMYGYKIYKFVIIGTGMVLGAVIGHFVSEMLPGMAPDWVWMGGCSLLVGGLAYGLFHSALALIGAVGGGLLGWAIMNSLAGRPDQAGYGAAVGIVLGGAGAFLLNRFFVTILTSVAGSYALIVVALTALDRLAPDAAKFAMGNEIVPLVWTLALALVAFWFQYRRLPPVAEKDKNKKKKAAQRKKETDASEDDDVDEDYEEEDFTED